MKSLNSEFNFFELIELSKILDGLNILSSKFEGIFLSKHPKADYIIKKNGKIIFEPFILAILNNIVAEKFINQALLGFLKNEDCSNIKPIQLFSDTEGTVYIPELGYLKTNKYSSSFLLNKFNENEFILELGNQEEYKIQVDSLFKIKGSISLLDHKNSLTSTILNTYEVNGMSEEFVNSKEINSNLINALNILENIAPLYFNAIIEVTKGISIFKSKKLNSFADERVFGLVFINVYYGKSFSMFIEEIAHQCGHLVFTTLNQNPEFLFTISPDSRIENPKTQEEDPRSIYVIMHGLFTYSTIIECLSRAIEANEIRDQDLIEALGRLAFTLSRFIFDLNLMSQNIYILNSLGIFWIKNFSKCCRIISDKYNHRLEPLDLSGQVYNFSLKIFLSKNLIQN